MLALACVVLLGYASAGIAGESPDRIDFGLGKTGPTRLPRPVRKVIRHHPTIKAFLTGAPQARVTDAMRKNLIGFDGIILGVSEAITESNRAFYSAVLPGQYLVPVGMDAGNGFTTPNGDRLIQVFFTSGSLGPVVEKNIRDAKRLAGRYPGLRFSYYNVTAFQMTRKARSLGYRDPGAALFDHFADGVSRVAVAGSLDLADWEGGFFRTDHHWNPSGAYRGYLDVMRLLSTRNPFIGEARVPFRSVTAPGLEFRGSVARTAALTEWAEPLDLLLLDEPGLKTATDGRPTDVAEAHRAYLAAPKRSLFASHYGGYYGRDAALRSFQMPAGRKSAGNLLVFSDSYGDSMLNLVATHFGQTYHVDLRHWESTFGEPFDMEAFVAEHGITDVLVLGRTTRVMATPTAILDGTKVL